MSPLEALFEQARRRLPRVAFDFIDGGAEDEVTLDRNRSAFDDLALIPRVLKAVGEASAETDLFGHRVRMPVLLAPAGAGLVAGPGAYSAAAGGAGAAGTISVFNGTQGTDITPAHKAQGQWFQVYLVRDRSRIRNAVERAKRLGFTALVLTGDVPVVGNRERDTRNGLTVPLKIVTPRIALDAARHPWWLWQYLRSGARPRTTVTLAESVRAGLNPQQTWDDLRWLRSLWDGPLVLKGVMCAEDAELAIEAGCEGVIVSNHGGRQLDGTPASIEVLPEVVDAVNGRAAVLLDGGIRRGTDVIKALSLGAQACLVGRPWVFAVVVGGEAAVTQMLNQLHEEITRTFQLVGAASIGDLGPQCIRRRPGTGWERVDRVGVFA
jgi:isopentenyl diphosphate isomerase/L-lactate dehydrogenase-like FMN-dependent dehydrogenase